MAFTFKQLKQAKQNIMDAFGLDGPQASKVVGYYNGRGGDPAEVQKLIDGDLSGVPAALSALGIKATITTDPTEETATDNTADNIASDIEGCGDVSGGRLPVGLYDDITATIEHYCKQYNIEDPLKMHPSQWKSLCIYIGKGIKSRAILQDKARYREVGFCYDGEKVAELLDLYEYICGQYKQVPFAYNFMHFAGISRNYFADYENRLTSGRVNIKQKAYEIQRAGLVDAVTGGGSATVGNIFLSKALAGLQESTTVVHVSASAAPSVSALPVFGDDGALLEEKPQ